MKPLLFFPLLIFTLPPLTHSIFVPPSGNLFPGYGFSWFDPVCMQACRYSLTGAILSCTATDPSSSGRSSPIASSPTCLAGDSAFLTSLAYCVNSSCDASEVPVWRREKFWATEVTGDKTVVPKWDYARALEEIGAAPTIELGFLSSSGKILNETVVVGGAMVGIQSRFMALFNHLEALQPRYIFVLVTIGFGTPIFLTLLAHLPFMTGVLDLTKPYLVYPSIIGTGSKDFFLRFLGIEPTIGQALFIAMFVLLNIVLSAVNYSNAQPHPWGFTRREETLFYIGQRTGHIAYGLLPLLILFSSRNNFLLWITDWPYSTYVLMHRWVARIFAIQAIVHSITLLLMYKSLGNYSTESKEAYWRWGIVATVLTCAMLILSHIFFRRLVYQAFLALHVLLAIFVIVGCWYHVVREFGHNFYDNWLFAACAVWFFDRLLRVLRMGSNGARRAVVTELGPDHVRIDVPGVRWASRPGYVAFAHFPTLYPLRPWENNPFAINSTALFRSYKHALTPASTSPERSLSDDGRGGEEKWAGKMSEVNEVRDAAATEAEGTAGVTMIVRKNAGWTRLLKAHDRLLTFLDGPYPLTSSSETLTCDRVLLIGGGIGITGLIAWAQAHPNVKLAWSVKSGAEALVQEMNVVLENMADKEIVIGKRLDIEALLRSEVRAGYGRVGVVVCGPKGMCDAVRAGVAGLGRGGKTVFELEVDAYSW